MPIQITYSRTSRLFAAAAGLFVTTALMSAPVAAQDISGMDSQDIRSMTPLGSLHATVGTETLEWTTLHGEVDGETLASASWQPITMPESPMARMMANMDEEQRRQMEETMGAAGVGVDRQYVRIRITGFDPESGKVQRAGMLSIELGMLATRDIDAVHAQPHQADVSYYRKTDDGVTLLVADTRSAGATTTVDFDHLELNDGKGSAEGRFSADLCPMRQVVRNTIEPESCITLEGEFTTRLTEQEAVSMTGQ
ncbi:hypothetical protein TVNIR_3674 [Thioalkalivibrio nitratireducens DSM 14787]|uniref:DUF3108 domain-containing protein n=1 Tax=Thioalkalivibrio nitratireducens (strain DSM 14787 / UNIQEM 213 / ALEN2) TaxID=1255043 RepID=L0E0E4_THIND|nr:hypothetical protein [Thioalkalivibrio nitratireducens]AGA35304.1 hypothetical protein TVNIR_3674 [Thioalkalivibrio nitratireducens DSM 14787]